MQHTGRECLNTINSDEFVLRAFSLIIFLIYQSQLLKHIAVKSFSRSLTCRDLRVCWSKDFLGFLSLIISVNIKYCNEIVKYSVWNSWIWMAVHDLLVAHNSKFKCVHLEKSHEEKGMMPQLNMTLLLNSALRKYL